MNLARPSLVDMKRRGTFWRGLSSTTFALIGLCFFLSFATVSCGSGTTTFTGAQLVTQTVPPGGRIKEEKCKGELADCVEGSSSSKATLTLLAAALGSLLAAFGASKGRGWCAVGGLFATLLLASPAFDLHGPTVRFHLGYDLVLLLFFLLCLGHLAQAIRKSEDAETMVEVADPRVDPLRLLSVLFWTALCVPLIYHFDWAGRTASGLFAVLLAVVGFFLVRALRDEVRFWRGHADPLPPVQG